MKLQLLQVEGNEGETVTAKVSVNKGCRNIEVVLRKIPR